MSKLLLCTASLCFWSLMFPPLTSMSPPQDRPVVYPADEQEQLNQIPESLLIQMKDIQNLTQLLDFLAAPAKPGLGPPRPIDGSTSPEYNITVDRKKLSGGGMDISRAAGCEPEMQTVELEKPVDTTHVYWPMCTRVARCGGCCTSSLLECVPDKTSNVEAKVLHVQYRGSDLGGQFEVAGFKSIKVEKHEKCSCQCREREEDCTALQAYKKAECRCMCTNLKDIEKCKGDKWIWDPKDCACKCREKIECSTGFFYNGLTCQCESQRSSLVGRKFAKLIHNTSVNSNPVSNSTLDDLISPEAIDNETTVLPTETTPTTTTTTKRTPVRVRARLGRPPLRESVDEGIRYKAQHVGIRPADEDDDAAPFTLARTTSNNRSRRIQTVNNTRDDPSKDSGRN